MICVTTDVLLLPDIFIEYRKRSHNLLGLDPIYSVSLPGFSNRALLKYTKSEIELFTDRDMHSMVQSGMRGGRCEVILRYTDAYNKYINEEFDKNKKSLYLMSLDANSLYGGAMTFKMPYKNHE